MKTGIPSLDKMDLLSKYYLTVENFISPYQIQTLPFDSEFNYLGVFLFDNEHIYYYIIETPICKNTTVIFIGVRNVYKVNMTELLNVNKSIIKEITKDSFLSLKNSYNNTVSSHGGIFSSINSELIYTMPSSGSYQNFTFDFSLEIEDYNAKQTRDPTNFPSIPTHFDYPEFVCTLNVKFCISGCLDCISYGTNDDMKCLSCDEKNGYFIVNGTNNCLNSTPSGYFLDNETKTYFPCYSNCNSCYGGIENETFFNMNCEECFNSSFLFVNGTKNCYEEKPEGYYEDNELQKFMPCYNNCLDCSQKEENINGKINMNCNKCDNLTLFFINGTKNCVSSPPKNYYFNTTQNIFYPCFERCLTCLGNVEKNENYSMNCLSCNEEENFFPVNNYNPLNCYHPSEIPPNYYKRYDPSIEGYKFY